VTLDRYTPPWDRFVEEWNAAWWDAGLDIKSTVIFRDEDTDRVAAVYYLWCTRFDREEIFVSYYDEDDIRNYNARNYTAPYNELDWPCTCSFFDEDRALKSASTWIDAGEIDVKYSGPYSWFYDYVCGHYWDKEEE